ncbi:MAG: polyprenyl synthetase family protein [Candidatus Omnitrophota bacterium]
MSTQHKGDVESYLNKEKERIDHYLKTVLPSERGSPEQLVSSFHYAVFSGGKRIRPILFLHLHRLCAGEESRALPAAAALELIHTFSLIQDDLPAMDNDDFRREKPSLHRAYDEFTALLASDYLLILAFHLLAKNYPAKISLEVSEGIGMNGLVAGQFLDLFYRREKPPRRIIEEIRLKKTAALFELTFKLAGLISGTSILRVRLLADYGRKFGLAFQIRDDITDAPAQKREAEDKMERRIKLLVSQMQKIELRLEISSPVLRYFQRLLLCDIM